MGYRIKDVFQVIRCPVCAEMRHAPRGHVPKCVSCTARLHRPTIFVVVPRPLMTQEHVGVFERWIDESYDSTTMWTPAAMWSAFDSATLCAPVRLSQEMFLYLLLEADALLRVHLLDATLVARSAPYHSGELHLLQHLRFALAGQ